MSLRASMILLERRKKIWMVLKMTKLTNIFWLGATVKDIPPWKNMGSSLNIKESSLPTDYQILSDN